MVTGATGHKEMKGTTLVPESYWDGTHTQSAWLYNTD